MPSGVARIVSSEYGRSPPRPKSREARSPHLEASKLDAPAQSMADVRAHTRFGVGAKAALKQGVAQVSLEMP